MRNIILVVFFFILALGSAHGATTKLAYDDVVIGQSGSTAVKTFTFGQGATKGCLKFNYPLAKMQFSHDCTLFEDLASGGLSAWESAKAYEIGDVVYYTDNFIYRATTANSDVVFTPANWQMIGGGTSPALSSLTDVTIATPLDTQILRYETSSGKWKNTAETNTGWSKVSDKVSLNAGASYVPEIKSYDKDYSADNFLKTGSFESVSPITCDAGTCAVGTGDFYEGEKSLAVTYSGTSVGIAHYSATNTKLAGRTLYLSCAVKAASDSIIFSSYDGTTKLASTTYPLSAGWVIAEAQMYVQSNGYYGFYIEKAATSTNALYVDQCKIVDAAFKSPIVNVVTQESISYTGYTSKDGSNYVKLATVDSLRSDNSVVISADNSTRTKYTINRNSNVVLTAGVNIGAYATRQFFIEHYNSANTLIKTSYLTMQNEVSGVGVALATKALAGDYFVLNASTSVPSNDTSTFFTIVASSTSENVITTYQDGTEWKSLTYTEVNALSGNQGFGTYTAGGCEYRRQESDLLYKCKLTTGTTTASEARIPLPMSLLTAGTSIIPSIQVLGLFNTSEQEVAAYTTLVQPSVSYINYGRIYSSVPQSHVAQLGNAVSSGVIVSFNVRIPISGWTSAPKLLALPVSKENVFSASISSSGIVSGENVDWIVGNGAYGSDVLELTLKAGLSSARMNCAPSSSNANISATISNITTTAIRIQTQLISALNSFGQYSFDIVCQKSAADYTPQGVRVGDIAGNLVGIPSKNSPLFGMAEILANGTVYSGSELVSSCTNANPRVCTFNSANFKSITSCTVSGGGKSGSTGGIPWAYIDSLSNTTVNVYGLTTSITTGQNIFTLSCTGN